MGTSSSFSGPGRSPLLPPWADDAAPLIPQGGDNVDDSPNTPVPTPTPTINPRALGSARSNFGRHASGDGGSLPKSYGDYVRAHGGAQNATQATRGGRQSTTSLGGFLSGVVQRGVEQTLRDFGL